jgi:FtsP/CotA-like multicopper oxidase with cupredoxin domain
LIHVHLEAHQVQRFNGKLPPLYNRFKKDTTLLGPGDVAEVFMKFRDYPSQPPARGSSTKTPGYVQHCHNIEHEDHAMMSRFDVVE